jgi:transcriptional regulator with PAS, ATPase and Fis domain
VLDSAVTGQTLLLGRSAALAAVRADAECASRSSAKVLITGETGVGKEIVARTIHARSSRASAPLVTINCAGFPDTLLESELFGHTRGSFTGAYRDKPGILETGHNGTVFLDELGEMRLRMQSVLLRFLETGEIQRIGATRSHTRVDVRLITATNRELRQDIAAGGFREDLYFRLNVIRIAIPPLRDRREDIPLLVEHFLDLCSRQHRTVRPRMQPQAIEAMVAQRWPGNVRELKNVIERLVLRAAGAPIGVADLPSDIFKAPDDRGDQVAESSAPGARRPTVDRVARRLLEHGESFWTAVHEHFMARDLTREDLRHIVGLGLQETKGNYRLLVQRFNMPPSDYKRFLRFLRKHDCHLPFQRFRTFPVRSDAGQLPAHSSATMPGRESHVA